MGPQYQRVLRLRHWHKMGIEAIAEAMGVHVTFVRGMLSTAYADLSDSGKPAGKRQTRTKSTKKTQEV